MSDNDFFELEEKLVELIAQYKVATKEQNLDFDNSLEELIRQATE